MILHSKGDGDNVTQHNLYLSHCGFRISVLWGQGLEEDKKIHELVKVGIQKRLPAAKVVITSMAHSGAVIGFNDAGVEDTKDTSEAVQRGRAERSELVLSDYPATGC